MHGTFHEHVADFFLSDQIKKKKDGCLLFVRCWYQTLYVYRYHRRVVVRTNTNALTSVVN